MLRQHLLGWTMDPVLHCLNSVDWLWRKQCLPGCEPCCLETPENQAASCLLELESFPLSSRLRRLNASHQQHSCCLRPYSCCLTFFAFPAFLVIVSSKLITSSVCTPSSTMLLAAAATNSERAMTFCGGDEFRGLELPSCCV